LQEHTLNLRHSTGHIFGELGLGGNGISKIKATTGPYGGLGHRFVSLDHYFFSHFIPPSDFRRLFEDGYGGVGAHHVAETAPDAVVGIVLFGGMIALAVKLFGETEYLLRTEVNAKAAAFATLFVDFYEILTHSLPPRDFSCI
jgi:hypothetical protein